MCERSISEQPIRWGVVYFWSQWKRTQPPLLKDQAVYSSQRFILLECADGDWLARVAGGHIGSVTTVSDSIVNKALYTWGTVATEPIQAVLGNLPLFPTCFAQHCSWIP